MILIENNIKIPTPGEDNLNYLKNLCTVVNPKYLKAKSLNLSIFGVTKDLTYYSYDKKRDLLEVPIGLLPTVKQMFPNEIFIDRRLDTPEISSEKKITFNGKLRDYQQAVLTSLAKHETGIIQAPTGSGKTVMMIAHLAAIDRPTLILVNTIELANQFIDRLVSFTNLTKDDIGLFGNGKKIFRPITVCLLQTLCKADEDTLKFINWEYCQVLSDEVHIVAANTYYTAMNSLKAKYKYGFSATPKREDGLTVVLNFAAGPKIHEIDIKAIAEKLSIPSFKAIDTDYYFPLFNTNEYQNMITDMATDFDRNNIILNLVKEYQGKQIVILCNRASQVIYLHKKIPGSEYLLSTVPELTNDFRPVYKSGKPVSKSMRKKDRESVINNLNSGKTKIIISTVGLFSTGIDIASLEILILASPIKSEIKLKQALGRIMRKTSFEKSPVFIDLVDKKIELLRVQAITRARIIKKAINV